MKNLLRRVSKPDGEHVVGPDDHRDERDAEARERHRRVAEDRLPREHRQDLGDDPERGQDEDVDLRVSEEPEEMLVEDGAAAGRAGRSVPAARSSRRSRSAAAITGTVSRIRIDWATIDQTKSGIRRQVIPGARMLTIVTRKLIELMIDETPTRWRPRIQRSWPVCGEYSGPDSGV